MQQRFFYGFIAISLVFCTVVLDAFLAAAWPAHWPLKYLVARGTLIPLAFGGLVLAGGLEMLRLMRAAGLNPHGRVAVVMSVVLVLSPWLSAARLLGSSPGAVEGIQWQLVWLVVAILLSALAQARREDTSAVLADLGATWLMVLYLGLLPSFAVQLRASGDVPGESAAWLVLIFLLVTKVSDIGAFLVGSAVGRHKLRPTISPKKSIEGTVGGILASVLLAVVFVRLYFMLPDSISSKSRLLFGIDEITQLFRGLALWQAIVFGALMSISGQLGDLLESAMKRNAGCKDSAAILPGFGGVLDLIDSPVLAAPVAWFLLTVCWDVV